MITHQKEKYNWEFVFLGANQDAFEMANTLNINRTHTMSFAHTSKGTTNAFLSISKGMTKARGVGGQSLGEYFDKEDYKQQEDEGVVQNNKT